MTAYIKRKSDGVILSSCSSQTVSSPTDLAGLHSFITSRGLSVDDYTFADGTQAELQVMMDEAHVATWEENRQAEYTTIEELVVALYDTDDKAAIEKRRSDVKAKYPKPE